jgi:hypothetical protein
VHQAQEPPPPCPDAWAHSAAKHSSAQQAVDQEAAALTHALPHSHTNPLHTRTLAHSHTRLTHPLAHSHTLTLPHSHTRLKSGVLWLSHMERRRRTNACMYSPTAKARTSLNPTTFAWAALVSPYIFPSMILSIYLYLSISIYLNIAHALLLRAHALSASRAWALCSRAR